MTSHRYPPTAPQRRWLPSGPTTPTTRACRSRTRSRDRCCRRWTAWRRARSCRSSPSSLWTSRSRSWSDPAPQRRTYDHRRIPRGQRAGAQLAGRQPADGTAGSGELQCGGRQGRRRRPRRRGREHRAGRPTLRPGRAGVRCRRRTQRTDPLRVGRAAGTAAPEHRCGPHVGGAAARQRARRAGFGDDRVRDPRHRPDPHRIPAHPKRVGHLHLLPRLCRTHRGRCRRRGTQGASPSLCRCAISGVMADGIGRRRGAAATRRGVAAG